MLTSEVVERQRGEIVASKHQEADPFVFSTDMVRDLQLMVFVRQVLRLAFMARPALPASRGGRPLVYSEESILVTILVMAVWQLSPRQMAKRLKRWDELARACGYQPGKTISASQ